MPMDANYGFNRETKGSTDYRKNQEERITKLEQEVEMLKQKLTSLEEAVGTLDYEVNKKR